MTSDRKTYRALAREVAQFDLWLLVPVLLLAGIGLVMVMSASSILAQSRYGDPYFFVKRQAMFLLLGTGLMVLCRYLPLRLYQILVYPALALALGLMIAVLLPGIGFTAGGATRWLHFGWFSIQPSEFAKPALVLYLAYSMAKKQDRMGQFSVGMAPHLIIGGVLMLLTVLQKDLGMSVMLGLLLMVMLFMGGARLIHLLGLAALAVPVGVALIMIAPYRVKRLVTFLDPWRDPLESGFQIIHSFLAFGSGGLTGMGIGSGRQKLHYLPEPHTDFVFSILGEEGGFVGVALVAVLFGILAWRGFYWAAKAQDPFARYLAGGLTLLICLQALVNMAVVLGLLPTTGLTLPLISYGGSSLVANLIAAGILLGLSARIRQV